VTFVARVSAVWVAIVNTGQRIRKADLLCHGVRTDRPYPPFSTKSNSSLRSSRISRSSVVMAATLLFPVYVWSGPPSTFCDVGRSPTATSGK
jgi:hypothetical protein